jgi:hypothetical protein
MKLYHNLEEITTADHSLSKESTVWSMWHMTSFSHPVWLFFRMHMNCPVTLRIPKAPNLKNIRIVKHSVPELSNVSKDTKLDAHNGALYNDTEM